MDYSVPFSLVCLLLLTSLRIRCTRFVSLSSVTGNSCLLLKYSNDIPIFIRNSVCTTLCIRFGAHFSFFLFFFNFYENPVINTIHVPESILPNSYWSPDLNCFQIHRIRCVDASQLIISSHQHIPLSLPLLVYLSRIFAHFVVYRLLSLVGRISSSPTGFLVPGPQVTSQLVLVESLLLGPQLTPPRNQSKSIH